MEQDSPKVGISLDEQREAERKWGDKTRAKIERETAEERREAAQTQRADDERAAGEYVQRLETFLQERQKIIDDGYFKQSLIRSAGESDLKAIHQKADARLKIEQSRQAREPAQPMSGREKIEKSRQARENPSPEKQRDGWDRER